MDYWALALLLLTLGLGLAMLEVFFPSGGILGFLCIASIVAAVVLGFKSGSGVGTAILLTALFGLPAVVISALHWLPDTPFGRQLILKVPTSDDVLPVDDEKDSLKNLIGCVGQARCKMLPAGAVKIGGRTIDAVTEGMAVEQGQKVRVIQVRGNRVVVRPVDDDELPPAADAEDPLSRPIDSLGLEPFDADDDSST
jgi:membrane-bound serine protease (ClpP class)